MARVDRSGGCWLWTGNRFQRGGYGAFYDDDQRLRRAHRVAFELASGEPLPDGQVVRHRCDTPLCVRPDHLELGSQTDNMHDMFERGRNTDWSNVQRGSARHNAVLTDDKVRWLRAEVAAGRTKQSVADELGVTRQAVLYACTKGWRHVV